MHAHTGDELVVRGRSVDSPDRTCEILEVRHADGTPPYKVRWDDGHEALVFPGPDAFVRPLHED
jgi:hypothetical protein